MIIQVIKKNGDQIAKLEVQFYNSYGKSSSSYVPIWLTPRGRYLAYTDNPCFLPSFDKSQAKNYNQIWLNICEIIIDPNAATDKIKLVPKKTIEWFDE